MIFKLPMAVSDVIKCFVAFILIAETSLGESSLGREDGETIPSKGSDIIELMDQLKEALNKLEEQDRETRLIVDELLSEKLEEKSRGKRHAQPGQILGGFENCYSNITCEDSVTVLVPGRSGKNGERGDTGETGERGPKGDKGSAGQQGFPGVQGAKGEKGEEGSPGSRGSRGEQGSDGRMGRTGDKGEKGQKGDPGTQEGYIPTKTVYTRWGSKNCPGTAQIIYEGYAAGAAYNQKGGGTSYLCLPRDPQFDYSGPGVNTWRGYLYGAEYEENGFPPLVGKDDGDVPCAVCLVTDRSVVLMQPARTDCPEGWTREYFGYLMASAYINYRSEWTCIDGNATLVSPESLQNSDGALFYPTEVCCGDANTGLPCDMYPNGYELTCSVCSR